MFEKTEIEFPFPLCLFVCLLVCFLFIRVFLYFYITLVPSIFITSVQPPTPHVGISDI